MTKRGKPVAKVGPVDEPRSLIGTARQLVSDEELCDAFRWIYARMKLACELGAAASTAAILSGKIVVERGQNVVAVVSGGNLAPDQAAAILASR